MAASVTDSVKIGSASAASTLESGTLTPTGSNKVVYAFVGSGATSPSNPSSVKYASSSGTGGESMTLLDSVRTVGTGGFEKISVYRLAAPSASSGTVWVDYGATNDERWIIAVAVQDADGTEGTINYGSASGSGSASSTATTTSGELVLSYLGVFDNGANSPAITAGETPAQELESGAISVYESAGASYTTASGSSTAMTWTISPSVGTTEWGLFAFQVNPAVAGDPVLAVGTGSYTLTGGAAGLRETFATVEYVGGAVGTNTATLPSFSPGDIAVVFAFRDGSATNPTIPGTFTSITNTTDGTSCSVSMGWRRLVSGDTTVGTWTNASRVSVAVYRGLKQIGTPVGALSAGANTTNASYAFPALTLSNSDGTSWVMRAAGHRSTNQQIETAPSGYTNRAASSGVDATAETGLHDSNGGVSSVTSGSVTISGTASGWVATSLELLADAPRILSAGSGSYTLSGQDVTFTLGGASPTLTVGEGVYTLTGQSVAFGRTYDLVVGTGSYTLSGQAVTLTKVTPGDKTALRFPSNGDSPSAFVAMYQAGADLATLVPTTTFKKVLYRQQAGYYTDFFYGPESFTAGGDYFGAHPYPDSPPSGTTHKHEISANGGDWRTDDNAYDTTVSYGRWYRQAVTARNTGSDFEIKYYWDLDAGIDHVITYTSSGITLANGTNPKFVIGDAWWNQQGERQSGLIRGIVQHTEVLSTTHIQAISQLETDAEVVSYASNNSLTSLHASLVNPTAADITDQSGNGNDFVWYDTGNTASTVVLDWLTVGTGSYVLSGQDVTLTVPQAYSLTVGQGTYTLSGQDVALEVGRVLAVGQGTYTLSGQDVALEAGHVLAVGQGSYTLSGQDVTLTGPAPDSTLTVGTGTYTLSGQDVALEASHVLTVGRGDYTLTGQDVALLNNRDLVVGTGNYTLSGQDVALVRALRLIADFGAYVLDGQDVTFTFTPANTLLAAFGAYVLTGQDVAFGYIPPEEPEQPGGGSSGRGIGRRRKKRPTIIRYSDFESRDRYEAALAAAAMPLVQPSIVQAAPIPFEAESEPEEDDDDDLIIKAVVMRMLND